MPDGSAAITADPGLTSSGGRVDASRGVSPPAVPDVVAPPPRHPRFPLIDGMRAIAVLAVVGVHVGVQSEAVSTSFPGRLIAHLNIGVTIFFLISGFLLYRPFIAHRGGGPGAPETSDYAKRRFLRIYPAYWVALTVLVLVPGLTGIVDGQWFGMYALLHTMAPGPSCSGAPFECGLAQTWSLVVEATFYLALPLYAYAVAALIARLGARHWVRVEFLVLGGVSVVSAVLAYGFVDPPDWIGGSVLSYGFWFALGMGMAVASVGLAAAERPPPLLRALVSRPVALWLVAIALYVVLCLWLPAGPFLFHRSDALVAYLAFGVIAALLLLPAVFSDDAGGLPRRLLAHPVMAWLGLISYGIFLWHYVVTLELGFPGRDESFAVVALGTLAITIPIAAASYYLVERPLLRFKYRSFRASRQPPAPVAHGDPGRASAYPRPGSGGDVKGGG